MALYGQAVFVGWHDVAPDGLANFYEWHDREHIPERLAVPGFLRIRRYRACDGGPMIANLMELANTDVLTGEGYRQIAANPTEWTRRTVPTLHGLSRGVLKILSSQGRADGGFIAQAKGARPIGGGDVEACLNKLALRPQVVAAHYCADENDGVLMIEAVSAAAATESLNSPDIRASFDIAGPSYTYQLEVAHQPAQAQFPERAHHGSGAPS